MVKREELIITTKAWNADFENVEAALRSSLEKLQMEYVDIYLLHWPIPPVDTESKTFRRVPLYKVWAQMEELQRKGTTQRAHELPCRLDEVDRRVQLDGRAPSGHAELRRDKASH